MKIKISVLSIILLISVSIFSAPQESEDVKQWEIKYSRLRNELIKLRPQFEKHLESIPSDFGTEKIQALKKEYMRLKVEYEDMRQIYKPTYPKMVNLEATLLRIREDLINEIDKALGELKIKKSQIIPGDVLEITVYGVQELTEYKAEVDKEGTIAIPLLNIVEVAGLTLNEIDKKLTELLKESILVDPQVIVYLVSK